MNRFTGRGFWRGIVESHFGIGIEFYADGVRDLLDADETGGGVVGGFIALNLLLFQPEFLWALAMSVCMLLPVFGR